MPAENIKRAIQRGNHTGELEGVSYEEITYEGYGPGGVAIIVEESLTDNKNRAVSEIRHAFHQERRQHGRGRPCSQPWMASPRRASSSSTSPSTRKNSLRSS